MNLSPGSLPSLTFNLRTCSVLVATILFFSIGLRSVQAQDPTRETLEATDAFVTEFLTPGAPSMTIYIWGAVGTPGIWRVDRDVDFIELLSAAQVTGIGQDEPATNQRVNLRIYRTLEGDRRKIYDTRLDDVLAAGASYPDLQDGDVLEVETERRRGLSLQLVSQIIGTASSIVLLTLRLASGR